MLLASVAFSDSFGHDDDGDEGDGKDPHEGQVDKGRSFSDLATKAVFVVPELERIWHDGRVVALNHQNLKCPGIELRTL